MTAGLPSLMQLKKGDLILQEKLRSLSWTKKVGNIDPSTGEDLIQIPFKCPRFQKAIFDPDFDNEVAEGQSLDTKRWIWVEDHFKSAMSWLLDLEGHVSCPIPSRCQV